MKMLFILAWRNLWRNSRRTWITVFSVVFAVLLSILLESVDRGSQEMMIENTVGFSTGYIQIQDTLYRDEPNMDNALYFDKEMSESLLKNHPEINFIVPRIESYSLAIGETKSRVCMVLGIELNEENKFNNIENRLIEGKFFDNKDNQGVVIGSGLSKNFSLGIGDTIVLLGQGHFGQSAAGKFHISGIFHLPLPEQNESIIYMPLTEAQLFYGAYDLVSYVIVHPNNKNRHQSLAKKLKNDEVLSEVNVFTWEDLQPELLQTLQFDQAGTLIFLLILYIVVAFGIFGTILTMTLEREKEFGVLISVGMHRVKLAFVIFTETLVINFLGVIIGIITSLPIIFYFYFYPISLGEDFGAIMEEYGMEAILKFSIDPQLFYQQAIIIFIISMIISIYPVSRILTLNVLSASRK